VAKLADARDLKSLGGQPPCGFETHPEHWHTGALAESPPDPAVPGPGVGSRRRACSWNGCRAPWELYRSPGYDSGACEAGQTHSGRRAWTMRGSRPAAPGSNRPGHSLTLAFGLPDLITGSSTAFRRHYPTDHFAVYSESLAGSGRSTPPGVPLNASLWLGSGGATAPRGTGGLFMELGSAASSAPRRRGRVLHHRATLAPGRTRTGTADRRFRSGA
jgi:hypothetical protein